jgi:truncated hemoglobin YjbI
MAKSSSPAVRRVKAGAGPEASLHERIGAEKLERLVAAFYARLDNDPVIRPPYGKTLTCAIRGLTAFMISWLGAPPPTTLLVLGSAADTRLSPLTPERGMPGWPA